MVAPLTIGGGITIEGGISVGHQSVITTLVLNLDAANYTAMPVDGTTIAGQGGFTITTLNPGGSMSWDPADGGIFRKTVATDTDFLTFGPDYSGSPYLYGTDTSNGGFDGLRLFGRYLNSTTSSEVPTADVGLVKVWDGVLSLSAIQTQWNNYKTRFGY